MLVPLTKEWRTFEPWMGADFLSLDSSVTIDGFRMVLSILFHSQSYGSFLSIVFYSFQQCYTLVLSLQAIIINKQFELDLMIGITAF